MESADGVMFWSQPCGQTRIYLRREKGWITVTTADRSSDESYVLSARSMAAIECYLFDFFGPVIRDELQLPVLEVPIKLGRVAPGYRKRERDDGYLDLVGPCGVVIARARRGLLGSMHLVVLSYLLDADPADIEATYLSVDGRPLFVPGSR